MDTISAINTLRSAAAEDPVVRDVFENFSKRERVWNSVALRPLWLSLREGGLSHSMGQVAHVMGLIASTGLGKKHSDSEGRVVKVSNLSIDLRQLGAAVIGDSKDVKKYLHARGERNIESTAAVVKARPNDVKVFPFRQAGSLSITLTINGKLISLPLPDGLEASELAALIERLKKADDRK